MLYSFRKAPKDLRMLYVRKSWHTKPKLVTSLVAGVLAIALGIGSFLMPEAHAYTANAFVMVVKTDNPGTSNATSFTIPITGTGYSYNVDCNDDGIDEVTARTTSYTCVYGAAGTYTIAITGTFPRIYFNNAGDRQKLLEVQQWGTIAWTSMANAFYGANNMHVTATDAPNLAGVTSLAGMFREATSFNENINHWNTSTITDMSYMFAGYWNKLMTFNQPLANWNTANVTNMSNMFHNDPAFNQPIGSWNTSAVTNMSYMLASAESESITFSFGTLTVSFGVSTSAFNQSLNGWDTSAVTNMRGQFSGATAFNQPLNGWDTSAVTDMNSMFQGAFAFNQPLNNWDTSAVTSMSSMFEKAAAFNQPLNNWDTSAVTSMSSMFSYAFAFNQPLAGWDTSFVASMNRMFNGSVAFDQPLSSFDTSAVKDMSFMFQYASVFDQPLSSFDTSAVKDMSFMFSGATAFNQPLTNFDTSAVTGMVGMFQSATAFNQPLTNFDTSVVTDMRSMFEGATAFNQPLTNFSTSAVTNMNSMFNGASTFNQPLTSFSTSAVTDMSHMFDFSGYSTVTYDQTLVHLASQTIQPNITLGAAGLTYCNETARAVLTSAPNNWIITDGGYCPPSVISPTNLEVISTATPIITGIASPSRTVHITLDSTALTTTAQPDGSLSYQVGSALSDGWHTLAVRSTDSLGIPGVPANLSFYVHTGGSLVLSGASQAPTLSWNKAPGTATGTIWSEAAAGATSFPARGSFGTASLNGKLWVVGGQGVGSGASSRLNDVWSSTDGVTWTQTLANAPWSARNAHTVTAFNGKLWVMGGQTTNSASRLNDVWSSPDGVTWTQELANAPWPARSAHETLVHDGKLWLIGGADTTDADLTDVWNSTDGINWTQVTSSADWPSRRGFGVASFEGKLWVMGGLINNWDVFENDVWSSTDGITWTEETANAAWPVRASHQVEVFDGKMWVLGGSAADWDSEYSDVWFSEDGKNWVRTTEAADWQARRGHSSAVFNDKLWVLGGRVGQSWTLSNDVWSAGIPPVTYTVCWDTTEGGCAHTATTTEQTFTIPTNDRLTKDTWYFSVKSTGPQGQSLGSFTSSPYTVTDPIPVTTPLTNKPVLNPLTSQPAPAAAVSQLSPALTGSVLSIASYDCSDLQTPTVRLLEPTGLKVAEANITLLGGVGFSVGCTGNGQSTDVALALGTAYTNTTQLRAYKGTGTTLTDITNQVTFTNKDVSGTTKTVLSYTLTDGGTNDEDGTANSIIVDPIYIGVVNGASTTVGSLSSTGEGWWMGSIMGLGLSGLGLASLVYRYLVQRKNSY